MTTKRERQEARQILHERGYSMQAAHRLVPEPNCSRLELATQLLQGFLANPEVYKEGSDPEETVRSAYFYADLLLQESK